jgi:hypothetical protein
MHAVFGMSHAGYLRNFESGIGTLLDRGHRVTVVTERVSREVRPIAQRLEGRGAFSMLLAPGMAEPPDPAGVRLRNALDYWHYLQPAFRDTPGLRKRALDVAPPFARRLTRAPAWARRAAAGVVAARERGRAVPEALLDFLRRLEPTVILLTPLIYLESSQVLWVRAAAALGIPSLFCVHSWDNLTTKGTLHGLPTRVLVWNEAQRTEAAALHRIPPERCDITGAPAFDHWFAARPSLTREAFLRERGLPPDRAVLLYLCSSRFIAKGEAGWVGEWLRALRGSEDTRVREAAVIVRPHPAMVASPRDWHLGDPAACVFPEQTENPVSDDARLRYFHSLHYADAVVGLNTTAMIEAAILDKPVLSVRQAGSAQIRDTVHFGHMADGLLTVAPDLETHVRQLAGTLAAGTPERSRAFVAGFVRPLGREYPAGLRFAELVEAAAGR